MKSSILFLVLMTMAAVSGHQETSGSGQDAKLTNGIPAEEQEENRHRLICHWLCRAAEQETPECWNRCLSGKRIYFTDGMTQEKFCFNACFLSPETDQPDFSRRQCLNDCFSEPPLTGPLD